MIRADQRTSKERCRVRFSRYDNLCNRGAAQFLPHRYEQLRVAAGPVNRNGFDTVVVAALNRPWNEMAEGFASLPQSACTGSPGAGRIMAPNGDS